MGGVTTSTCVLWGCLIFLNFSFGCDYETEPANALQDEVAEPRGRHRLQLLFPLLLRISTRLATLVPTAILGLLGIMLFVVFSKKAFIISLFALFLSLSGKYGAKSEDVHVHKLESYPDYNDEEHIHYHHHGPPKYKHHRGGSKKWRKHLKRTVPSLPRAPGPIPLRDFDDDVKPFKPLTDFHKYSGPRLFPDGDENSVLSETGEWNSSKRQVNRGRESRDGH